jgi:hypothetical protein
MSASNALQRGSSRNSTWIAQDRTLQNVTGLPLRARTRFLRTTGTPDEVLVGEPCGGHELGDPGSDGPAPMDHRAGLRRAEAGAWPGALRGARLAGIPSSCHNFLPQLPLPLKGIAAYGFLIAERSRFPPQPALDRSNLPYPKFHRTGSRAGRAQRHNPRSIATLRILVSRVLAGRLPCCPLCCAVLL